MKINKGLGYIATAVISIAMMYFFKDAILAIAVVFIGFNAISVSDD